MSNHLDSVSRKTSRRFGLRGLVALVIVLAIVTSSIVTVIAQSGLATNLASGDSGTYTASIGDYQLTVDKSTLNFSVDNGSTTWHSGERYSDDDGLNKSWAAMLNDAFTIGYIAKNNAVLQKAMSQLGSIVNFTPTDNGFNAHINCVVVASGKAVLEVSFDMQWVLSGDKVEVTILGDSIEEISESGYSLAYIIVYPFFNASFGVTSGYVFVPDGSGAVIDTSVPTVAKKAYSQRVYGDDVSVAGNVVTSTSPMSAYMGVYGLVNSDSSVLVSIDEGAEYAEINSMVSGITTKYNVAYTKYIFRQLFTNYVGSNGSEGDSYMDKQVERNVFDIKQTYHLLSGDSTVGQLAQCYQSHLANNDKLVKQSVADETSLRLMFLVYESKSSMLGSTTIEMTNFDYIKDVITSYSGKDVIVSLMGIDKSGMVGSYPFNGKAISRSVAKQLEELSTLASSCGVTLSVNADFSLANSSSSVVGVRDRAMSMANQYVYGANRLDRSLSSKQYYLLSADSVNKQLGVSASELSGASVNCIEANAYGWMLYSSYDNQQFSRSDMMNSYMQQLSDMDSSVALDCANEYLWKNASYMYNVPTDSSQFVIESHSVPFMQMVLSGYVDCYSMPINLDYKGHTDILKLIEYNTFMSYVLTEQNSIELYGTESQYIFSSQYSLWKGNIDKYSAEVSSCLNSVRGSQFIDYIQPTAGISVSKYSNGVDIVVNYTNSNYMYNGTSVPANSALAISK